MRTHTIPGKAALLAAALAVGLTACADGEGIGTAPDEGELVASLIVPPAADPVGAVRFEIRGPGVEAPTSTRDGLAVFTEEVESGAWQVAALGHEIEGALVRFRVPDTRVEAYTVTLIEVAGVDNELLARGSYRLEVQCMD